MQKVIYQSSSFPLSAFLTEEKLFHVFNTDKLFYAWDIVFAFFDCIILKTHLRISFGICGQTIDKHQSIYIAHLTVQTNSHEKRTVVWHIA